MSWCFKLLTAPTPPPKWKETLRQTRTTTKRNRDRDCNRKCLVKNKNQKELNRPPDQVNSNNMQTAMLSIFSFLLYLNSLNGDFVFDDVTAIVDNADLRSSSVPVLDLFKHDFWGMDMGKEQSHKSYRPLTVLTFRLNFALSGLDPWYFHLTNAVLHACVVALYHRLCLILTSSGEKKRSSSGVAMVAALLFAAHPVHTEAVSGVVGRAELLSSLFFLASVLAYARARTCAALISAACAMLSKEQGITGLAVCAAYEIVIKQRLTLKNLHQAPSIIKKNQQFFKKITVLAAFTFAALYARLKIVQDGNLPSFSRFDNPAAASPAPTRHLSYLHLAWVNLRLLLLPDTLLCDWTMGTLPLITSFFDLRNLTSVLTLLLLTAVPLKAKSTSVLMSYFLMVIPFLPASNLLFPVGFVVAERVLYLPSMGFCLLISIGFHRIKRCLIDAKHQDIARAWNYLLISLICVHSLKTLKRNVDWKDELNLFKSGLKVTQSNAKLFNNVGHALERVGRNGEALEYFEVAAKVQPDDIGAHINTGRALNSLGRLDQAEEAYERAKALMPAPRRGEVYHTKVIPSHLSVYVNLAVLVARNDSRLEEADTLYRQAISMRGDYAQAYINRGDVLVRMNRSREAVQVYREALEFAADNPDLLYNLGAVLAGLNETVEALQYWNIALQHNPGHHQTLLSSALLIQDLGIAELYPLAISRLKTVAEGTMADEKVYFNLGMLSMDEGLEAEAEHWFKLSVRTSPDFRPALFNLALLLSDSGRALEVEPLLRRLLRSHPNHIKGLMLLADLQVSHLGQLDEAELTYLHILELDPSNLQAKHNLCVVMAESGRLRLAAECLRAAAAAAPRKGAEYVTRHLRAVEAKLKEQEEDSTSYH